MDTKSKKSKLYSKGFKATAVTAIVFLTLSFVACGVGVFWATDRFNYSFGTVSDVEYEGYTETTSFRNDFCKLIDDAVNLSLHYKSEGNIREGRAIDEAELLKNFKNYYGVADGIITSSTKIKDDYTVEITADSIPEELMDNFYEYSELVSTKLRGYRSIYIQTQLDDFIYIKKELDSYNNFFYYIENSNSNVIAGNSDKKTITALNQYLILDGEFLSDKMKVYTGYMNEMITDGDYTLYAGISNSFLPNDKFYENEKDFGLKKQTFPYFLGGCIGSVILGLLFTIYLMRVAGQEEKGGAVTLSGIDRIFNDIHIFGLCIAAGFSMMIMSFIMYMMYQQYTTWYIGWGGAIGLLAAVDVLIALSFLCSMSRQSKTRMLCHNTLIAAILRKVGETLSGKSLTGWVLTLFALYTMICLMLFGLAVNQKIFAVPLVIFISFCSIIVIKNMESLMHIMRASKSASKGDYKIIEVKKISSTFSSFATDINNIQSGLKTSIAEAVKGERMKADLITNVSHDLKTPLTSIISYVGLLDREELNNPVAEGYVDILVDKSERLKQLIEDLIEASKASSGNLSVEKGKIDLKQLLLQACGEFEERAQGSKLEFRIATKGDVFINADGKHMWRIYENLLSNVIKYAMPNSRIYIDIYKDSGFGIMSMKNISQDEIQVNVENLAERFIRGDSARTTEGSGLGLSIAKSLAVLQDGRLEISVDGDMFKVLVEMPLYVEDKNEKALE